MLHYLTLLMFFMTPLPLLAHGTGASFEREVGEYLVDIGYSVEEPVAGESITFDFALLKDGETAAFTDIWVKIESEDGVVLATGIHSGTFGGPRLTYVFPKSGSFVISTRYERGDDSLAEASFELPIASSASEKSFSFDAISALTGLLLGAVFGFLFSSRRQSAVR